MNIEDLTIAQAREIAAMFGGTTSTPSPYASLMGQRVIVRANKAGVYAGTVIATHPDGVTLGAGARQLWYWSAGGSVLQVAERGIRAEGSKVTAPSSAPVVLAAGAECVSVHPCTDLAWSRIMGCAVWTGGLND